MIIYFLKKAVNAFLSINSLQTTPILMGVECARRRCYKKVWKLYKVSIVFTD